MPDHVLVSFLKKFDRYPFCVKSNQEEYRIGEGEPEFTVNFKRPVSLQALMTSTSLALGEAYMDGSQSLRRHYNRTLLCWNRNFQEHRGEVVEMFDEQFARMWELFLCSCAATFMNGIIDLHQIIFTNDVNNDLPMTKWY